MTEKEWLQHGADPQKMVELLQATGQDRERRLYDVADPDKMLKYLEKTASERKFRLFAVACCRLMFTRIGLPPRYEREVDLGERYADGVVSSNEVQAQRCFSKWNAENPSLNLDEIEGRKVKFSSCAHHACLNTTEIESGIVVAQCASLNAAWGATQPGNRMPDDDGVSEARLIAEQAIQCYLLRDIVGNPFRPISMNPTWLTPTVTNLATIAYNDRDLPSGELDTGRLAVLADALEESGCDNQEILGHLRSPGPHVRGCHVVDLILGRD